MNKKEYKKLVTQESHKLKKMAIEYMTKTKNSKHPTQYLTDVIKETYGHNIKLQNLINLIEESPLTKERKKTEEKT